MRGSGVGEKEGIGKGAYMVIGEAVCDKKEGSGDTYRFSFDLLHLAK